MQPQKLGLSDDGKYLNEMIHGSEFKPGLLHQNEIENFADPLTCGMEAWENYSFAKEWLLIAQNEKEEHERKQVREDMRRYRAKLRKGKK